MWSFFGQGGLFFDWGVESPSGLRFFNWAMRVSPISAAGIKPAKSHFSFGAGLMQHKRTAQVRTWAIAMGLLVFGATIAEAQCMRGGGGVGGIGGGMRGGGTGDAGGLGASGGAGVMNIQQAMQMAQMAQQMRQMQYERMRNIQLQRNRMLAQQRQSRTRGRQPNRGNNPNPDNANQENPNANPDNPQLANLGQSQNGLGVSYNVQGRYPNPPQFGQTNRFANQRPATNSRQPVSRRNPGRRPN